jgi:hypothetical protein
MPDLRYVVVIQTLGSGRRVVGEKDASRPYEERVHAERHWRAVDKQIRDRLRERAVIREV